MPDVYVANDGYGWPVVAEEEHVQDIGDTQNSHKIVKRNDVI